MSGKRAPAPTRQFDSIDALIAAGYAPRAPLAEPEPEAPAKPTKKPGVMDQVSDLGAAAWQGVKGVARNLGADLGLAIGNNRGVERLAANQAADAQANTPAAQRALEEEIQRRKDAAGPDTGVLQAVGEVADGALDNKMGAAQMVAGQLPSAAVSLGGGWAGAQSGAALGSLAGPVGTAVGGTLGFLGGMFLGNALLETGSKGMEKAQDGLTDEERGQAR